MHRQGPRLLCWQHERLAWGLATSRITPRHYRLYVGLRASAMHVHTTCSRPDPTQPPNGNMLAAFLFPFVLFFPPFFFLPQVTETMQRKGCTPCLDMSAHLRAGDSDEWHGPARAANRVKQFGPCYKLSPRPRSGETCWNRQSNDEALKDPRGVVIAGGNTNGAKVFTKGVGLGNQLFAAAGLVGNALRFGRLPAVGCNSCFVDSILQNFVSYLGASLHHPGLDRAHSSLMASTHQAPAW